MALEVRKEKGKRKKTRDVEVGEGSTREHEAELSKSAKSNVTRTWQTKL